MREYDVALKLVLQHSADRTLRELTGGVVKRWLNVETPRVNSPRVDLLAETEAGEVVDIELQSTNDHEMPVRMAEYHLSVYRSVGRFPRPVVLYVGDDPLRMRETLDTDFMRFQYRAVDIRDLDGRSLLESEHLSDNILAILTRLRDSRETIRTLIGRIAELEPGERAAALSQLVILAGLRHMGAAVIQEAIRMPILNDILDHDVLGPEFRRGWAGGELNILRRQIEARFGGLPAWAAEKLANSSAVELEALSTRVLDAQSLEELLG